MANLIRAQKAWPKEFAREQADAFGRWLQESLDAIEGFLQAPKLTHFLRISGGGLKPRHFKV